MIYLDTSCLLKLYYPESNSGKVASVVSGHPLPYLQLHELEFQNALRLKVFRKEATDKQVRRVDELILEDTKLGVLFSPQLEWNVVFREAVRLAAKYTGKIGCRSLDILHCAAALTLSVKRFVTADLRQAALAKQEGLRTLQL